MFGLMDSVHVHLTYSGSREATFAWQNQITLNNYAPLPLCSLYLPKGNNPNKICDTMLGTIEYLEFNNPRYKTKMSMHNPCNARTPLLCVSCPSANEDSAILFLLLVRSSSNSHRSFQRFRRTLRRNFKWNRQQMKNFPIDPHCKICPLSATL